MLYFLVFLTVALYFFKLGSFQVWSPNEAFYAEATRQMLQSGDFLNPYYNGELRLNKPPMTYWLVSLGYLLLGVNELGLRLMHALLGVGTGLLTFLIARELTGNWQAGILSLLILLLSLQFFASAQYASPEVPFTFFITLSLYLWLISYRRKSLFVLLLAFISSSLAMLVKGPAGFVLPAGVVFLYLLLENPRELLKLRYYLLSLPALLLGLGWHGYQLLTKGELFWEVFYKENIRRIYHGDEPIYFYLLDTNVSFLPYSLLFFPALLWVLFNLRRECLFPLVWFTFVYGLFSLISQKIPLYVLPAFPALAIITSCFLLSQDWERLKRFLSFLLCSLMVLALLLAVFFFSLHPALLLLLPLPFFVFFKEYRLSPAVAGILLVLFLKTSLLPYLEGSRGVKELGKFIKSLDPESLKPTYQLGHFHHSLPFYSGRRIIRGGEPQRGALVVFRLGYFGGCEPVKTFRLYTGSESRLFKFLMDARRGKNFADFGVCLY
ncbi:MAG: glycosyltransferase family 39 protein [Aquificaceae bacterium]|nr:glycosyltransferase family 39 protein [Aquificaceae bacterium]